VTPLILWDVDQTLLYSGGAGSLAMRRAFERLYGVEDGFRRVEFSGRTDWAILKAALEQHGLIDPGAPFDDELRRFQETYYGLLPQTLRESEGGRVMPGVPELLSAISDRDARQGLATGNFRRAAFMKLDHFGLEGFLSDGGFGDDAEVRADLVAVAIERLSNGGRPETVWVIGDTPLDIEAAHANGALALGVATGQRSVDELRADGADLALEDLSDTAAVVAALLG
jgi:phosphoglycolate phosphatase-like HAD superfamily hydrolase